MTIAELGSRAVELALARGVRVAVAESLTGGLLADALVSVPGASRVFAGGIIAYDTALKRSLLAVDPELLHQRGPVDGGVAEQMAQGVRRACAVPRKAGGDVKPTEFGLATTGVAGPDADPQTGQPAGTVWIGVSSDAGGRSELLSLRGTRGDVREGAVRSALALLIEELGRLPEGQAGYFPES